MVGVMKFLLVVCLSAITWLSRWTEVVIVHWRLWLQVYSTICSHDNILYRIQILKWNQMIVLFTSSVYYWLCLFTNKSLFNMCFFISTLNFLSWNQKQNCIQDPVFLVFFSTPCKFSLTFSFIRGAPNIILN